MDYRTLAQAASDEFIERKSRFIGHAAPATTEAEAIAFISSVRERYRDASHNVYAYNLREGQLRRYSDDGEPQGTAGIPVLDVLLKGDIVDAVLVVTRYFGGTLLGAGGLVRAYSHAAKLGVDAAGIRHMRPCTRLRLKFDYSFYGKLSYILPDFDALVEQSDFGAQVELLLLLADSALEPFYAALGELFSGQAHIEEVAKLYSDIGR